MQKHALAPRVLCTPPPPPTSSHFAEASAWTVKGIAFTVSLFLFVVSLLRPWLGH